MSTARANARGEVSPSGPPLAPPAAPSTLTFSFIVPVCHGGAKFDECLKGVAAAMGPRDELVVVADGEGDGSWRLAEQSEAEVIRVAKRRGPAHARNIGARQANGDILFFVDADVVIPADARDKVREVLEQEPDVAAIIGSYDDDPSERNFLSQFKNLFHHFVHQHASTEASTFWGACGAIRREVFFGLGGYNEDYDRPSIEDIEFGYRLKAAAHRIRLLSDLQVKHLKKWTAQSLIKTDVFDRAVPWTELIWDHFTRQKPRVLNDLNVSRSYRISLITSFVFIGALIAALFKASAVALAAGCALLFILLQIRFFRFFQLKRGPGFALQALAWRFGYDLYSGVGFCYGSLRFANASTRKILSEAFAKLDAIALGAGVGTLWGGATCAATVLLLLRGGSPIGPNLSLLGQFFPAYTVTWLGSLVGLVDGFVLGFAFGFSFACARNVAMRVHLGSRKVQKFLQRGREV